MMYTTVASGCGARRGAKWGGAMNKEIDKQIDADYKMDNCGVVNKFWLYGLSMSYVEQPTEASPIS